MYDLNDSIDEKIRCVAKKVYGAEDVEFSDEAMAEIEKIQELGCGNFPVCIAKTQYSFSDDPKNLQCEEPFKFTLKRLFGRMVLNLLLRLQVIFLLCLDCQRFRLRRRLGLTQMEIL